MNTEQEKTSVQRPLAPREAGRRGWARWLASAAIVAIVAISVGAVLAIRHSEFSRDYKVALFYLTMGGTYVALAVWFLCQRFVRRVAVRVAIVLAPLMAAGLFFALFKPRFTGDVVPAGFFFRWGKAADAELASLANLANSDTPTADLTSTTEFDYPRFLGPRGMAIVENVELETDWELHPPKLVWPAKREIGAGWSAFAVVGDYAVTQEQRGDSEMVVCYALKTGEPVWAHADEGRFSEMMGGDGPRATPTIDEGKVYTLGAFGILNCLDGATGNVIWSKNILEDNGTVNLKWGKSGSPLVVDDLVVVSAGGPDGHSLVAYDKETGERVWSAGDDRSSYASPALATLGGARQILTVNEGFVRAYTIEDGRLLWSYPWESNSEAGASISQPAVLPDDHVLLSMGYQKGSQLLKIRRVAEGRPEEDSEPEEKIEARPRGPSEARFEVESVWKSPRLLQTKLSNVVYRGDYVYGISGGILECVDWRAGKRKWRRRGFGHGQVILVGDTLLVTSERGEVALVRAQPERYEELARFQAIEGEPTWNNPALAGRYLLIRNSQEAACYELPLRGQ